MSKIWLFIAQGFGSGRSPWAPGTFGTLVAIPIYLLMAHLPLDYYLLLTAAFTGFGFWVCDVASKQLGEHDHPSIVWDEIVGFLWTMVLVPSTWLWILAAFLLFRLFDIWKPWPISWADRTIKGGTGVMVDDLIAALFAWIVLQIALYFI